MENVTVFHRDPAAQAILRTELAEGTAVGPGCASVCRCCNLCGHSEAAGAVGLAHHL